MRIALDDLQLPRSSYLGRLDDGTAIIQQLYQLPHGYRAEVTLWGQGNPRRIRAVATTSSGAIKTAMELVAEELNGNGGTNGGRERDHEDPQPPEDEQRREDAPA